MSEIGKGKKTGLTKLFTDYLEYSLANDKERVGADRPRQRAAKALILIELLTGLRKIKQTPSMGIWWELRGRYKPSCGYRGGK